MQPARRQTSRVTTSLSRTSTYLSPFGPPSKQYAFKAARPYLWTCCDCRGSLETPRRRNVNLRNSASAQTAWVRQFSTSSRSRDGTKSTTGSPSQHNDKAGTIATAPLPSHTADRRWDVSKKLTTLTDNILARASIAGQHINVYTGTDYSGIEALRQGITEQEQRVRTHHNAVDAAKSEHHDAYGKQTSAQREIVGLLERKSSWLPSDLERYMSLVRSEHTNEQAVQEAKDNLAAAERELEDARSLLERLERKQYHEEQIWSDTIRRNSTWVTFGLMGVNILLLLAQIAIFEPYRRQRIVQDVKHALDEKTLPATEAASAGTTPERNATVLANDSKSVAIREFVDSHAALSGEQLTQLLKDVIKRSEVAYDASADGNATFASTEIGEDAGSEPLNVSTLLTSDVPGVPSSEQDESRYGTWEAFQARVYDLFSDRIIQIRKSELTGTAMQGVATGVIVTGLVAAMVLRAR